MSSETKTENFSVNCELQAFRKAAEELIALFVTDSQKMHELLIFDSQKEKKPGSVLSASLPYNGKGITLASTIFSENIAPNLVRNYHSRFFNWVVGGRNTAAVLGDFYTTVFDQIVMLAGHGIASEIENQTMQWLLDLFELPTEQFQGVFTSGATEANLCALAAARQWHGEKQGINVNEEGLYSILPPKIISGVPHSSINKALQILGLGTRHLISVDAENVYLDISKLKSLLKRHPNAIVVTNCGEVNTGHTDNLRVIAQLCQEYNAWLHVDAAFGLFSRCHPEYHTLSDGIELADSITCDGHKLGNVPYGCGFLFLNKRNYSFLIKNFATVAPYLSADYDHPMNTRIANSQRLLALPMWFSLLAYGKKGYQDMIERQFAFAAEMGKWIEKQPDFELLFPIISNIVLFRCKHISSNKENQNLIEHINNTNQLSLSGTVFNSIPALRIAVANWDINIDLDLSPTCDGLLTGLENYFHEKEAKI